MYEKANDMILWWDPKVERVRFAQFTTFGDDPPIVASTHVQQAAFDGQVDAGTDAQGRTQPAVTVFDGLLRATTPTSASWTPPTRTWRCACARASASSATCRTTRTA